MDAPFCKESFFNDIKSVFAEWGSKSVYVTHPMDSHLDHQACGRNIYSIIKSLDKSVKVFGYFISPWKIPRRKRRIKYKYAGQLKERYLDSSTKSIKTRCINEYKSQNYLFDLLKFHNEVERYWNLKSGVRAKIFKKISPDLKYIRNIHLILPV